MSIPEIGSEEVAAVNDDRMNVENVSPNHLSSQVISEVARETLTNASTHKRKAKEPLASRITQPPEKLAKRVEEAASLPPLDEVSPVAKNLGGRLENLADRVGVVEEERPEPNLLLRAIEAGLRFEKAQMEKLSHFEEIAQGHLDTIDELLDLNAKLAALPDKEQTFPQEIKDHLIKLKEKGIDLGSGTKLSKEKLKPLINSRIDALRTKITTTFNHMQGVIQEMNSVNETVKHILQQYTRQLMATLTRNQRPGG